MFNWAARKVAVQAFFKKVGLAIGGLPGFIVTLLADKVSQALINWIERFFTDLARQIKDREARKIDEQNQKKYEDTLNSETKTKEDIKNATTDFLNGRK